MKTCLSVLYYCDEFVCALEMKSVVKILRFPGGLQESDFLNRLKSTFPQLRGQFDAFTTDATRTLTPLKLKKLTPREIQRSIKSRGKGRSALYIRAQVDPPLVLPLTFTISQLINFNSAQNLHAAFSQYTLKLK